MSFHRVSWFCCGVAFFMLSVFFSFKCGSDYSNFPEYKAGRVVLSAPVLLVLSGGDNYLAANLEMFRLSATGFEWGGDMDYLVRAHEVVSRLNPCHEHNYYLSNAALNWGGAFDAGAIILRRATDCRLKDEFPPFFYGFNQYFFNKNLEQAVWGLDIASRRATKNAAGFRKLIVMMKAEEISDEQLALKYLEGEREVAADEKLRALLSQRVERLKGLFVLREAQRRYEKVSGRNLQSPDYLISSGVLVSLPVDPTGIGYDFIDGRFNLRKLKVAGMEGRW